MINDLPSKDKFDSYVKLGLLKTQSHPELPLTIYRYSIFTNYDRLWNIVTLQARGIVMDEKGRCVIRCIRKFFNEDEPHALCEKPNAKAVTYYDKLDGSLIQVANDSEYGLIITSSCSFTSKHVGWAKKILERDGITKDDFRSGYSYIFELIHPENRIVVDYKGKECLVLIAVIENSTGLELKFDHESLKKFQKVDVIRDIEKHMDRNDVEGVVAKTGSHRYKMKTGEYVRLHRLMTDFTTKRVWEAMKEGSTLEFENMPEEFNLWLKTTIGGIKTAYDTIEQEILNAHEVSKHLTPKELGLSDVPYKGILFRIRSGQDYSEAIWKEIKPKGEIYE